MSDRSVRSLLQLQNSASTARVLNLHKVWADHPEPPPPRARLFEHPALDRALVIKHRLRRDETDLFHGRRHAATKVILPIDVSDLKLGGHSVFVGQIGYVRSLEQAFGTGFERSADFETLAILDALPSLDPFLLREHLRRHGRAPDRRYFGIADADMSRMFAFARGEVGQLVGLSFGEAAPSAAQVSRLVQKILSDPEDPDMEPLRHTLRLQRDEWAEGMFCWKGFLYYKWSLSEVASHVGAVLEQMGRLRPTGQVDEETAVNLARSRAVLRRGVQRACATTSDTLRVYDEAYAKLVREGAPAAFREFLLDAPTMFATLGERLGAISHVVSFWRYRFPPGAQARVAAEELLDVFTDFESSLNFSDDPPLADAQAA